MDYEIAKDAIEDAVKNRKLAGMPDDKGLSEAHEIICKGRIPITEHPDVQRLIIQKELDKFKYDTLKASHDKLVEALDKHGRHSKICLIQMIETHECICGFSQALKEAKL